MVLLSLFKMVLVKPPRGGPDRARARAAFTMGCIEMFEKHELSLLLPAVHAGKPWRGGRKQDIIAYTEELVRKGSFAKACKVLTSPGPMEESEEMLQMMLDKQPRGEEVDIPITLPRAILVSEETVMKQLCGFTRGTSFGALGAKDCHILDIINVDPVELKALTGVVNCILSGRATGTLAVFFGGGDLYALPPKGRPIVVGNLYSRLVSKCAAAISVEDSRSYLEPLQLALSRRGQVPYYASLP